MMKIVAGLGNPGDEYRYSRHNIGFMILDKFAENKKLTFKKEGNALIAKRNTFTLVKPLTYMNLSGSCVKRFTQDTNETLIVCDDIYLPFGEIRLRESGGDGGHNGLKSIIEELATPNFHRMRIGVGQPAHNSLLKEYVLEDFSKDEFISLEKYTEFAIKLIDCYILRGYQTMLNYYSKNKKSYSEKNNSESTTTGGN